MKNLPGKSLLFALLFAFLGTGTGLASTSKQWEFRVYLDDSEIGFHRFTVREQTGRQHVISEAHFDVDFLFFNAYRYRHYNYEVWDDNCLISIQARTDDNGEEAYVIGEIAEDTLQVKSSGTEITLPGCIRSFAYWNPAALLEATRLLNSQTGDYQPVSIQNLPVETLQIGNATVQANRYRIIGKDLRIDLWYSPADEWLALESQVSNGSTLRYRID